jgi:cysteine desulfuration protein SufE
MPQPSLEELIENFALLNDWEERYRYLIDLGKALPPMDEALKTEETFVKGCTSQVWLVSVRAEDGTYVFIGDSDAHIVRGLIAVLFSAYQGKTPDEIAAVDIEAAFGEMGLNQHLSPNRRNGFFAMVERIRALSAATAA